MDGVPAGLQLNFCRAARGGWQSRLGCLSIIPGLGRPVSIKILPCRRIRAPSASASTSILLNFLFSYSVSFIFPPSNFLTVTPARCNISISSLTTNTSEFQGDCGTPIHGGHWPLGCLHLPDHSQLRLAHLHDEGRPLPQPARPDGAPFAVESPGFDAGRSSRPADKDARISCPQRDLLPATAHAAAPNQRLPVSSIAAQATTQ